MTVPLACTLAALFNLGFGAYSALEGDLVLTGVGLLGFAGWLLAGLLIEERRDR
jgi:hypothetical protein